MVLRVPVGLWLLWLSLPRLLCSSLLLVCEVASAWLALSWLRSPPALPAPVSPLVPSGPVSVLLVPPSGYATVRLSACGMVCCDACLHFSSWQQRLRPLPSTPCCGCCSPFLPALRYWGGPPLGVQILYTFPTPKMGMKQIEQFSDIVLHFLRFLAESSGVAKLELFQPFPHCKWGFSRCTDSARLRQDSAAKGIKTGTKLW